MDIEMHYLLTQLILVQSTNVYPNGILSFMENVSMQFVNGQTSLIIKLRCIHTQISNKKLTGRELCHCNSMVLDTHLQLTIVTDCYKYMI